MTYNWFRRGAEGAWIIATLLRKILRATPKGRELVCEYRTAGLPVGALSWGEGAGGEVDPLFKGKEGTGVIFENYNRNDIISIVE